MQDAVATGRIPGGVVLIGHNGKVVYRKAFGWRSLEPTRERMTVDTIFDLASLTKCIATTTAMMQLVEQGRVRLNDPVAAYLPEFAQNGKGGDHRARTDDALLRPAARSGSEAAVGGPRHRIPHGDAGTSPSIPPGTRFVYSDINFETLGFLVEKVTGLPLNEYASATRLCAAGHARHALSSARRLDTAHCAHAI